MKQHLVKNTYAAIVALFITLFALPTTAQAQNREKSMSAANNLQKRNVSVQMPNGGNKAKIKPAKAYAPASLPLFENFEGGGIPSGWTIVDADNDGKFWEIISSDNLSWLTSKSGKQVISSWSHDGETLDPDNYLITPELSGAGEISYWLAMNCKYIDHYQVLASTTGKNPSDFTKVLLDETPTDLQPMSDDGKLSKWVQRTVKLPAGTKYVAFRHCESSDNNYILLDDVTISNGAEQTYDLKIGGVSVTPGNCNNLSSISGVSGTMSYNPATNILTLQNVTIKTEDTSIESKIEGLILNVIGTNNITSTKHAAVTARKTMTITGGGTINAEALDAACIYADGVDLTIENCTVNAKGLTYGICGWGGHEKTLTIKNATVTAEGARDGSIIHFKEMVMSGCEITQPAGAKYDAGKQAVVLNGETVTSKIVISRTGGEGVILYESFEGTEKAGDEDFIWKLPAGWTTIDADNDGRNWYGIGDAASSDLRGYNSDRFVTSASWANGTALKPNNYLISPKVEGAGRITFYACIQDKDAPGDHFAVCASTTGTNESDFKIIKEWTLEDNTASAPGQPQLMNQTKWQMYDTTLPAGTKYIAFRHFNCTDKFRVNIDEVTVYNNPTAVDHITIDTPAAKRGIYTISGVKLNGELKDQPKGIYIVDGKKVVKK